MPKRIRDDYDRPRRKQTASALGLWIVAGCVLGALTLAVTGGAMWLAFRHEPDMRSEKQKRIDENTARFWAAHKKSERTGELTDGDWMTEPWRAEEVAENRRQREDAK